MNKLLDRFESSGIKVLRDPNDTIGYLTDYRKRYVGKAYGVVLPENLQQVAQIVTACAAAGIAVVPQGGNTGLVGGSVPDDSGNAVLISLKRMNKVRAVDVENLTMTIEAGCTLQEAQDAAERHGLLFPLSLASQGSCTLGGNLSSNAGGVQVLRYGNARELCLGIEAVMPDGTCLESLRGLRKDNTGYALKDLLIGAEGTLGVVTAAVMKLFPRPHSQVVCLLATNSVNDAVKLLGQAQRKLDSDLTGFELMGSICLDLVAKHFQKASPLKTPSPYYVLLESSSAQSQEHNLARVQSLLESAMEAELIQDAALGNSIAQNKAIWQLRELISEAQSAEGKNIKHDISVPISRIADFVETNSAALTKSFPGMRLVNFGHLGDGNLHYNVSPPIDMADDDFMALQPQVNNIVYDQVVAFGGSISAEHGLGQLKRDEIAHYKAHNELAIMRTIKNALDPKGIMNPGKIFAV